MYIGQAIAPVDSSGPSWWERILGGIQTAVGSGPAPTYPTPQGYPPGYPYPPASYPGIWPKDEFNWMPIIIIGAAVGVALIIKR